MGNVYTFRVGKIVLSPFGKGVNSLWELRVCFRVHSFQKGPGVQESKQEVTKVISLVKMAKIRQRVAILLS